MHYAMLNAQVRLDSMRIRPVPFLGSDTPMYDLLRLFQVRLHVQDACSLVQIELYSARSDPSMSLWHLIASA